VPESKACGIDRLPASVLMSHSIGHFNAGSLKTRRWHCLSWHDVVTVTQFCKFNKGIPAFHARDVSERHKSEET
jgi:hypothetical protein